MKKVLITLALLLAFVSSGLGQGTGPITVKEADGYPSYTGIRTFIFDNGTVTISGNTARIAGGGGGSGTVTTFSCVTANGVSCSVANATTTPAATFTLGAITPTSVNGLTISTVIGGVFTLTNSKTFTVSNTLTLAGTDSSTLNIGTGGTLGTAAYTAATAYEVPLTFSTGLTRSTNTITVNTTQNIAKLSNLTSNGFVKTSGGDGTLSVDTATYLTGLTNASTTIGSGNTTRFLYNNSGVLGESGSGFTTDGTNVTAGSGVFRATSPRVTTSIFDANGLPILRLSPTSSATQSLSLSNDVAAGTISLVADVPAVATTTVAGTNIAITASAATVASTTPGAAAGGSVTITTGAAARLSSGDANGGDLNFVLGAPTGNGTSGGIVYTNNNLTTNNAMSIASSSATSGKLLNLTITGTAALTNNTVLNISNSGATSTNAQTTYGAIISNTRTNATSGTNVALQLTASGATTANTALNVTAGQIISASGTAALPGLAIGANNHGFFNNSNTTLQMIQNGTVMMNIYSAGQIDIGTSTSFGWGASGVNNEDAAFLRKATGVIRVTNGALNSHTAGGLLIGSSTATGLIGALVIEDVILRRAAAANLAFGAADAAAPVAQTISVQNVVAGTSNTAGANFTIAGSRGTGTGAGGSLIFQVAPAGSTGTSQNALSTAMTIASDLSVTLPGALTVASCTGCGSGTTYATSGNYYAFPQENFGNAANTSALVGSANQVRAVKVFLNRAITIDRLGLKGSGGSAGLASFGIYNADGSTRTVYSGTIDTNTGWTAAQAVTVSSSGTVGPGYIMVMWTADNTSATIYTHGYNSNWLQLQTVGTAAIVGTCANAASTGALPSTCGTFTADSSITNFPMLNWYKN